MKLITYRIIYGKYYKDKQEITQEQAKKDLSTYKYKELILNEECKVRNKEENNSSLLTKKEEKLLEKERNKYKVEYGHYRTKNTIELWKKNKKYDYYNFLQYLENDKKETVEKAILNDLYK